jgi:hypothetical protein
MLVFDGEVDTNTQTINWVNPIKQNQFMVEIELEQLDFLPPNFEQELLKNLPFYTINTINKNSIDSIYYALANLKYIDDFNWNNSYTDDLNEWLITPIKGFSPNTEQRGDTLFYNNNFKEKVSYFFTKQYGSYRIRNVDSTKFYTDYADFIKRNGWQTEEVLQTRMTKGGVNPKQVEMLKKDIYQGTWIATKEFERRLHILQQEENGNALLDTYCSNLHKKLVRSR